MNKVIQALADWKSHKISRHQFLQEMLKYDRWMLPRAMPAEDLSMAFCLDEAHRNLAASGATQLLLFSCGDTVEEFDALYSSAAMLNPIGWEVFSADLGSIEQVIVDQGSHHELVITKDEFPEWFAAAMRAANENAFAK